VEVVLARASHGHRAGGHPEGDAAAAAQTARWLLEAAAEAERQIVDDARVQTPDVARPAS
jgi:hypothetical protein